MNRFLIDYKIFLLYKIPEGNVTDKLSLTLYLSLPNLGAFVLPKRDGLYSFNYYKGVLNRGRDLNIIALLIIIIIIPNPPQISSFGMFDGQKHQSRCSVAELTVHCRRWLKFFSSTIIIITKNKKHKTVVQNSTAIHCRILLLFFFSETV